MRRYTPKPRGERTRPFPPFLLEEDASTCEFLLIMPPSKVCPQCDATVPIRVKVCKSCHHVFRAKRQAEQNLPDRAMKRLRVILSDSAKSIVKAKDKLRRACKRANESSEQTLHRQRQDKEHKTCKRANESSEQTLHRQQHNYEHMANIRANESSEQTLHRQQHNCEHMANIRANESSEQTLHRQQHNCEHMANIRANESSEQTLHRQQRDREHKASVRSAKKTNNSVQQALVSFHTDIKNGPDLFAPVATV